MKLYLHIGTEKTGTTAIQTFFRENRDALIERGVLYPQAGGPQNHTGLAAAAMKPETINSLRTLLGVMSTEQVEPYRQKFREALQAELSEHSGCHTTVFSNEHCSSRLMSDEEVHWLRDFLVPLFDDIKVVCYIRSEERRVGKECRSRWS